MKRILTPILALVLLMTMSACEKTNVIENFYPNPNKSFIYTVKANQWSGSNSLVNTTINLPELNNYYMQQGGVSVAISFDKEGSYDILPATFDAIAYSVRYSLGKVTIYAEDPLADESIFIPVPDEIIVKVILSETDYIE